MTVKDTLKNIHSEVKLPKIGSTKTYKPLLSIVRNRVTVRKFDEKFKVPDDHYKLMNYLWL